MSRRLTPSIIVHYVETTNVVVSSRIFLDRYVLCVFSLTRASDFSLDYPHWDMKPVLKRYYLMQFSYWIQQLMILGLGLEKPRKDFKELVIHHFVTIWLIGCVKVLRSNMASND